MELNFYQQSIAFLWSIPLGVAIGILYGAIKFIRTAFDFRRIATIISDIVFMLISTVVIYLFSIAYIQGFVRIYVFIGCIIGFLIYRLSIGRIITKIYSPIISFISKIIDIISSKFKKIAKKLLKNIHSILYNDSNKRVIFRNRLQKATEDKRDIDFNEGKKAKRKKSFDGSDSQNKYTKRDNTEKA